MRRLLYSHVISGLIGAVLVYLSSPGGLTSYAIGAAISFIHLSSLVYAWPRLLAKKQVALSIVIIVFKFAILGWILYLAVNSDAIRLGWLAVGIALVVPSVIITALFADKIQAETLAADATNATDSTTS